VIRVYFDWNVFSNLQNERNETFASILSILQENSSSILLPYSMAHLDDLRRGMGKKEGAQKLIDIDLKFLFDLTAGHYLHLDAETGSLSPRMESPSNLFHGLSKSLNDQSDVLKMLEGLGKEGNDLLELLQKIPGNAVLKDFQSMLNSTEGDRKMFPTFSDDASLLNLIKDLSRLYLNPDEHSQIRREARNDYRRALKIIAHNEWGEPFDYLQNILNQNIPGLNLENLSDKTAPLTNWSVFRELYLTLDTFGYYGDSKVPNLIDDVFHSFFAAHCDVFVTDDERTFQKAKAVYKQLNLSVEVCKSVDFPAWINRKIDLIAAYKSRKLTPQIGKILATDVNPLNSADDEGNPFTLYKMETPLLNCFSRMQFTSYGDGSMSLFMYKKPSKLTNFWFWTEISSLVNKLYQEYGVDLNGRSEFNWEHEISELQKQTWVGRIWRADNYIKELLFDNNDIGLAYRIIILTTRV
jgi:hypothetical protein